MDFIQGKLVTYKGKKYKMQSQNGDFIVLKCAAGCPKIVKVHKDQI